MRRGLARCWWAAAVEAALALHHLQHFAGQVFVDRARGAVAGVARGFDGAKARRLVGLAGEILPLDGARRSRHLLRRGRADGKASRGVGARHRRYITRNRLRGLPLAGVGQHEQAVGASCRGVWLHCDHRIRPLVVVEVADDDMCRPLDWK